MASLCTKQTRAGFCGNCKWSNIYFLRLFFNFTTLCRWHLSFLQIKILFADLGFSSCAFPLNLWFDHWFSTVVISWLSLMSLSDMSIFVAHTGKGFSTIFTNMRTLACMSINMIFKDLIVLHNFSTICTLVSFWVFWFGNSFYNNLVQSLKMRSQRLCDMTNFSFCNRVIKIIL